MDLQEFREVIADEVAALARSRFVEYLASLPAQPHESPLEEMFWLAWQSFLHVVRVGIAPGHLLLSLRSQVDIEADGRAYRLDFSIVGPEGSSLRVAIELDGHEFHERTKEQVAARDRRDRALQQAGWTVLHFSGSEFHRRGSECIAEAYEYAEQIYLSSLPSPEDLGA